MTTRQSTIIALALAFFGVTTLVHANETAPAPAADPNSAPVVTAPTAEAPADAPKTEKQAKKAKKHKKGHKGAAEGTK